MSAVSTELDVAPLVRGDCVHGPRPCPWVRCRHHLAIEVRGHRVKLVHGTDDLDALEATCVLDVVDAKGRLTLDATGRLVGLTRERIRQIEERAEAKLLAWAKRMDPGRERKTTT